MKNQVCILCLQTHFTYSATTWSGHHIGQQFYTSMVVVSIWDFILVFLKLWDIGCILLHIYHSDLGGVDKRNILTLQAHLREICHFILKKKTKTFFFINLEIKNEEISETQTNDQRNHSHVSPKHQGSQVETEKEVTRMAEGKLKQ